MYSKKEASQLKEAFWTAFGQYMLPIPSAEGEKINWVNYKTGEKFIQFRMWADGKEAGIAIDIIHKDAGVRQLLFEQLAQFRKLLFSHLEEEWNWQEQFIDEDGRHFARVGTLLEDVSVFRQQDWPQLISFFKPRIIALDAFWSEVKYSFEALR